MVVFFSCKKNTEQDIKGSWSRMILDSSITHVMEEVWDFDGSKIRISQTSTVPGSTPHPTDSGTYVIKSGLNKRVLRTNGFVFAWFNNLDWRIERLKDGQMVLFSDRDNYFLYYEFVRKY